jgi:hypothetical protein
MWRRGLAAIVVCLGAFTILFSCSAAAREALQSRFDRRFHPHGLCAAGGEAARLQGDRRSAEPNEDSGNVLRNLEEWVIKEKPDVVHMNAGLHDLKLTEKGYQVPVAMREKPESHPGAYSDGDEGEDYLRDVHAWTTSTPSAKPASTASRETCRVRHGGGAS